MKKTYILLAALMTGILLFSGCGNDENAGFKPGGDIHVVSREDGSGTRGAFTELMNIIVRGDDGSKSDKTTKEAIIANKTDVMLTNIAGDEYAIGYVSVGSLKNTVKAVEVDGVVPSSANVKNGSYKVARPFNIATKENPSDLARDFISFILSADGQKIVSDNYIEVDDNAPAYSGGKNTGKIVVAGSSSVTPVVEKLKEAYIAINTDTEIEVLLSDSTAGMTGAIEGTCDIGMASRSLSDEEKEQLSATKIAIDGIAIIVNPNNPIMNLTTEQVNSIYTGKITKWSDVTE